MVWFIYSKCPIYVFFVVRGFYIFYSIRGGKNGGFVCILQQYNSAFIKIVLLKRLTSFHQVVKEAFNSINDTKICHFNYNYFYLFMLERRVKTTQHLVEKQTIYLLLNVIKSFKKIG